MPGAGSPIGGKQVAMLRGKIQALELEASTYGKSAEATMLYRLELDGLTESQRRRAEAAIAMIEERRQEE